MSDNQPIAFAALGIGAILLTSALTGNSLGDILKGHFGNVSSSPANNGVAGVGAGLSSAITGSNSVTGGAPAGSVSGQVGEVTPSMLAQIGKKFGWTGQQLQDWMGVIERESGGNPTAVNSGSGAYGIAQGIDGPQWYAQHGGNVNTVSGQLEAMANYIKSRYGDPSNALSHEDTNGWY